jgi:hypothetical protein
MRRTLAPLAVFAAVGIGLALLTAPSGHAPVIRPRVHGHGDAVRRVRSISARAASSRARARGWRVDASPASPARARRSTRARAGLAGLHAVDAFRASGDLAALGLAPPEGTIALTTARGTQRLALGALNAAGSTFYARREGHGRVLQLGVYLMEIVRRVVAARDAAASAVRGPRRYWPEIG